VDRLAAEGMRFTQHYAGNAVCAPSRCVLMTGKHPGHAFIRDNREAKPEGQFPIPSDTVTLAKLLKQRGYTTGAFGKWGLGAPGSSGDPPAGVRPLLRLQLPARRAQLLSRPPLGQRPPRGAGQPGLRGAPEVAGGRRSQGPQELHGLHRQAIRAGFDRRPGAGVHSRKRRQTLLSLFPDDRAASGAAGAGGFACGVRRPMAR